MNETCNLMDIAWFQVREATPQDSLVKLLIILAKPSVVKVDGHQ